MTLAAFQATMPRFDWRKYNGAVGAPKFQVLNVATPDFFKAMNDLLDTGSADDVRAYLRWHVLHAAAPMLPKAFADADFDFFSRTLAGQQAPEPRWRRCVNDTDRHLGEALGKAFVDEAFSPQAKADTSRWSRTSRTRCGSTSTAWPG